MPTKNAKSTKSNLGIDSGERKFYAVLIFLFAVAALIVFIRPQYTELVVTHMFTLLGGIGLGRAVLGHT